MKPYVVIFSSSPFYQIATAVESHLKEFYHVKAWKGFFGENKTTPLWTFFKKLFFYDYAIVVLSNDHIIQESIASESPKWVPRDNVIFELGATMARLGPQKTIILMPDKPKITLPGYFDDVQPFIFKYQSMPVYDDTTAAEATMEAAVRIREILDQVTFDTFHSELPAQGLAYAYLQNFLLPVIHLDVDQVIDLNGEQHPWTPASGLTVTVIIPDKIMGRNDANSFFEDLEGSYKTNLRLKDGRDPGIYALPRQKEADPLHVLDIPTTLLTAKNIIERIEQFWRQKDHEKITQTDEEFMEELRQREIIDFRRSLDNILLALARKTYVISVSELPLHLEKLRRGEV